MAFLSGAATLSWIDLYTSDTTPISYQSFGAYQEGPGGRWFRYAAAGASNLVVGNVLQSKVYGTTFNDLAVPAAVATNTAAGSAIVVTNGTTVLAGGELIGGSAEVSVAPGLGDEYTITGNSAAASGGALTLYFDRPIRTAWTTSTKVNVTYNDFNGVIQTPATTLTGNPVGVAIYAIPATQYGFIQTHGDGAALSDATLIIMGSAVASPSGTAGAVTLAVAGLPTVGVAKRAAATGKTIPVFLTID